MWDGQVPAMCSATACAHQHLPSHTPPPQGALSLLGPVMWGWLAMDLALKAIGTDYARVIRAVFLLAQV